MRIKRLFLACLLLALLSGCSSGGSGLSATATELAFIVAATQTALAASPTPSDTPAPTATLPPSATPTPTFTFTPAPTFTLTPTPSPTPTPTGTATLAPTPTRTARPAPKPTRTPAPTQAAPPAATVPGGIIVFAVHNAGLGSFSLYTVRPDGSDARWIADNLFQPDVGGDGWRILAKGLGGGKDTIWDIKVDGSDWRRRTQHPEDSFPTWSADEQHWLFSSSQQGDGVSRLYTDDDWPVGTSLSKFIVGTRSLWLLNGDVVFGGCDYGWGTDTHCGTWVVTPGGMPRAISDNPQDIPMDSVGSDLLFLRPEGDNWDIYRVALGGGAPTRLTDSPGRDGPAAFSPDGTAIAFLSERSGTWALYTMDGRGGRVQKRLDLPLGGDYDTAPAAWTEQRISWGPSPAGIAEPTPVDAGLLPAPQILFPIWDDTVSASGSTPVRWEWSGTLAANQGFQVRFWHSEDPGPAGVTAPIQQTEVEVHFGATETYLRHGNVFYSLDVVVVQIDPYEVLSQSAPIRVKAVLHK